MSNSFEIRIDRGGKAGFLPEHYDIFIEGQKENLVTVWDSLEMAEEIVNFLEHRTEFNAWLNEKRRG